MKYLTSLAVSIALLCASSGGLAQNDGFNNPPVQERPAPPSARVVHSPQTIQDSTRFGWAVVLRVDPVYDPTDDAPGVTEEACTDASPPPPPPPPPPRQDTRTGGTVIGALVGGVVGNLFGKGDGRKASTAAGVVAGAAVGHAVAVNNDANANAGAQFQNVEPPPPAQASPDNRNCREVREPANRRIVGYDVEYRYGGEVYMTRLAYDPGDRMRVRISVVPAE